MKKKVEITKVTIKLKDKEIELTPEEARQIRDELNDLLGKPAPEIKWIPAPYDKKEELPWSDPFKFPPFEPKWRHDQIICRAETNGVSSHE